MWLPLPLFLYRLLSVLCAPLVLLWLKRREKRGKEHASRLRERFGHAVKMRPEGTLVWVHAASVGEALSVLPLMSVLLDRLPQLHILLTTGTVTSAAMMETRLPPRAFHQFVPVDMWPAARRFLHHWRPDLILWTESELWPNLLMAARQGGIPSALLSARMSPKSYAGWRRFPRSIRALLATFRTIFPQSTVDAEYFAALGAPHLPMLGNLKYDAPPLPANEAALEALDMQIGGRPLWLAASTHPGEEVLAAEVHGMLKETHPTLLTMIVPRHAQRGGEIADELRAKGYQIALRSAGEPVMPATDIYLADTMGELGMFYRLADIVFMGGSLVPHGGQNPLEPARLRCALIVGPHTENFIAICAELESGGGLRRIKDAPGLAQEITRLLADSGACRNLMENAYANALVKQGVMDKVIAHILPLLDGGA